ncbi:Ig-like domain-containing protein [candidate division CSSED10-310 bacterium]|uniref:Ig-like domain-containing protein n=1 Tax=candidate division CSSED10-310 bacterium TaxID=2855610 RepID=A0ABV6Z442_UNCC1
MDNNKTGQYQNTLFFKGITIVTLLCFTLLTTYSCVSMRVKQTKIENVNEKPSISMKMYLKKPQKGHEQRIFHGLKSSLSYQDEAGEFIAVASSQRGSWILKNSPQGKYKIEINDTITVNGKTEKLEGKKSKTFTINPNQRAEINIYLKKVSVGWIIVLCVLIVGVIIWIILKHDDLPDVGKLLIPPLPPLKSIPILPKALPLPLPIFTPHGMIHVGPTPVFIDGGFYMAHSRDHHDTIEDSELPTEATSFYPGMNSENISPKVTIVVYFSKPMKETSFQDRRIIRVLGSKSGHVKGLLKYDQATRKMEFIPEHAFAAGETVTVTLMGKLIHDKHGKTLSADYEWSFTVTAVVDTIEELKRDDKIIEASPESQNEATAEIPESNH